MHIRVRRARTSCETSLTILAFSFGDKVVNHLARRCCGGRNYHVSPRIGDSVGTAMRTDHFALPREQDQIAVIIPISASATGAGRRALSYLIAMMKPRMLHRQKKKRCGSFDSGRLLQERTLSCSVQGLATRLTAQRPEDENQAPGPPIRRGRGAGVAGGDKTHGVSG